MKAGLNCLNERKEDSKRTAQAQSALHLNRAAVLFNHPFRETQSEARAFSPGAGRIGLIETLENSWQAFRRNAGAGVLHFDNPAQG